MSECDCGRVENGRHHRECPASGDSMRREQAMSDRKYTFEPCDPLPDEQCAAINPWTGAGLHNWTADERRLWATIDALRQRAEQAEADRRMIAAYLETVFSNAMQSAGHPRDKWRESAHPDLSAALGRAK